MATSMIQLLLLAAPNCAQPLRPANRRQVVAVAQAAAALDEALCGAGAAAANAAPGRRPAAADLSSQAAADQVEAVCVALHLCAFILVTLDLQARTAPDPADAAALAAAGRAIFRTGQACLQVHCAALRGPRLSASQLAALQEFANRQLVAANSVLRPLRSSAGAPPVTGSTELARWLATTADALLLASSTPKDGETRRGMC